MGSDGPLRVAILWMQLAGYTSACFRALAAEGVDIHLVYAEAASNAPYDVTRMASGFAGHHWGDAPDEARIEREMESFSPDAILVCSWNVGAYRRVARSMRGRTLRVLCMDNAWMATPKQWAGVLVSPFVIRPAYDIAFLPGERQAAFARRLGFSDDQILWGLYTCDHDEFSAPSVDASPVNSTPNSQARFVFVGRLVESKGADVLAQAYVRYRGLVSDPWPLLVCGVGPLAAAMQGVPGVELRGFVQPADLPLVFHQAACLVLPSTWEPWGVVVHEATTAGLAVVCTAACGAASRLVLDGYNGAVVKAGDHEGLARAMADISDADPDSLRTMRARSEELARQFTPQRWARYLVRGIERHRDALALPRP